jgi:hypothetical protein
VSAILVDKCRKRKQTVDDQWADRPTENLRLGKSTLSGQKRQSMIKIYAGNGEQRDDRAKTDAVSFLWLVVKMFHRSVGIARAILPFTRTETVWKWLFFHDKPRIHSALEPTTGAFFGLVTIFLDRTH